ncbi:hypothetical protein BX589_101245 [Paraburkholderia fungorum]|jgi:hypothetical protein|uniref:hypothetical protein n=1 Tax=Paraburkholderia fungorum TaxID=134537 RepID=UPI000D07C039|nr:hypothetical protein [Paraburkholderia fungorum]PRZ56595.1 hypothetical protein BX589_101245 [Paraburkholderia fungorum]
MNRNCVIFDHTYGSLAGMEVIVDEQYDRVPRMVVSTKFADLMPPEFVVELNAWMVEFFGTTRELYRIGTHTLVMGPRSFEQIKSVVSQGGRL